MLLRFGVENLLSIREYQELSLVVPKASDQAAVRGLIAVPGLKEPVVPLAGIYGANASGKSNVLECMSALVNAVQYSHSRPGMPGGVRKPFLLDEQSKAAPSRLECDVVVAGERYQYGFRIDARVVLEEWLYAFTGSRHRVLFHRNVEESEPFYFGPSLKGNNRAIREQTRTDSLFLSTAGTNNHPLLKPVWDFFRNQLVFAEDPSRREAKFGVVEKLASSSSLREEALTFLRDADLGIVGVQFKEVPVKRRELIVDMAKRMNPDASDEYLEKTIPNKEIVLLHRGEEAASQEIPFNRESRGTQTMLGLVVQVLTALEAGSVLVVDELESGLHPMVAQSLVEVFQDRERNPKGAQLLFATHNTRLLEILAPAQVWLCEKSPHGATELFPLTAVQPRKGENLERGYLKGRYGGIPYLAPREELWRRVTRSVADGA